MIIGLPAVRVRRASTSRWRRSPQRAALDALVFNAGWFSGGYTGMHGARPTPASGSTWASRRAAARRRSRSLLTGRRVPDGAVRPRGCATPRSGVCSSRCARTSARPPRSASMLPAPSCSRSRSQHSSPRSAAACWPTSRSTSTLPRSPSGHPSRFWPSPMSAASGGSPGQGVFAGLMLASNGVMATLLDNLFCFNQYQAVIAGLALMLTAVASPDGVAKEMQGTYFKLLGKIQRRLGMQPAVSTGPVSEVVARTVGAVGSEVRPNVLRGSRAEHRTPAAYGCRHLTGSSTAGGSASATRCRQRAWTSCCPQPRRCDGRVRPLLL